MCSVEHRKKKFNNIDSCRFKMRQINIFDTINLEIWVPRAYEFEEF